MTHINRQRYMAELSKLLAFMFKEDKEDILAQYNKLLDEAEDEQALLESFGSPTKLAVTISRTYKRSERKLAVEADSKSDKPEAEHLIVTPVKKDKEKEKPQVIDTGLSYADIIEEIRREKAAEEGVEYKPMFFNEPEQSAAEEEPAAEETAEEAAATEMAEPAPAEETPEEEAAEEEAAEEPEQDEAADGAEAETGETVAEEAAGEPPAEEETLAEEAEEKAAAEPEEAEEPVPTEETPEEEAAEEPESEEKEPEAELVFEEPVSEEPETEEQTIYKTNVALLILYLIFAIPIGLVLLVLSVALTAALLGLGVLIIALAAKIMAFAFSSLVIFADIMLCAGAMLIAFAAALVLLWLGILMLVCGIKGVAGGVVSLGRKLCVKEVAVNG